MRDPKRIDKILKLIKTYWKKHPDMRLTQLIMNALQITDDPYYIEDEILHDKLQEMVKK